MTTSHFYEVHPPPLPPPVRGSFGSLIAPRKMLRRHEVSHKELYFMQVIHIHSGEKERRKKRTRCMVSLRYWNFAGWEEPIAEENSYRLTDGPMTC